jgi:hypothetical protein
MKKVEVKNFSLYTTGLICIDWNNGQENLFLNVDLDLAMMLKMMKIEGLTENDITKWSESAQPIRFKKVTLLLFEEDGKKGSYYTSDVFTEDDDPTVFHVEIKE